MDAVVLRQGDGVRLQVGGDLVVSGGVQPGLVLGGLLCFFSSQEQFCWWKVYPVVGSQLKPAKSSLRT